MTISDPNMISKWENLQNSRVFKYLLSSLYMNDYGTMNIFYYWIL